MARAAFGLVLFAALRLVFDCRSGWAQTPTAPDPKLVGELTSDFKYTVNNAEADAEDVVTAPFHVVALGQVLRNPTTYYTLIGAGALFGGSYALDQTVRSHLREMSGSDATVLEDLGEYGVATATGGLYAYGLYAGDARARQYAITAGESAGIATLIVIGIKAAFGRLRPNQDGHSHTAFFAGGQSFVSGEVTPVFALAAGLSEYFDNKWYIAAPIYSVALLDGFGRMGHDAHWLSDVIGGALLGVATTELLLWMHHYHEENPSRFRIFPVLPPSGVSRQDFKPAGLAIAYTW